MTVTDNRLSHVRTLRVAFVGEVDHGKSTLIGRLLLDAGGITADRLTTPVRDGGLAFLLDGLAEERDDMFTLDTAQAVVESDGRRVELIDVPGHLELLKNMVTGSSRADVGVIVVDATAGVVAQTRRHLRILELLGVRTGVCAVTKMDLVDFDQATFAALAADVAALAAEVGIDVGATVPVSAIDGRNVTSDYPLAWYDGDHLLRTLHTTAVRRIRSEWLRFAVQSVLGRPGERMLVGRVESGVLYPGRELVDPGTGRRCRVESIERFGEPPLSAAVSGDSVGLRVTGAEPSGGAILAPDGEPLLRGDLWSVRLLSIADRELPPGPDYTLRYASTSVSCAIERIERRWNSATLEPADGGDGIGFAEIAAVRVRLHAPAAADPAAVCPPTGRFMLCDARGEAVALGIVDNVTSSPALMEAAA